MTPAARAQAAIDLLDAIIAAARGGGAAADTLIARYFKDRRYAGSKDRRAVRDLVYAAIRRAGEIPATGRAALLGLARERPELLDLFDGSAHGPALIEAGESEAAAGLAPAWLVDRLGAEATPALLGRAPLDLRANRLKAGRDDILALFPDAVPTPFAPDGVRLAEAVPVEAHPAFTDGAFEVQDEGSQLVSLGCGALPGMTVVDLCAGAGGKTLALAAAMGNSGRIIACDTDRARLQRLPPRAQRAGVTIAETLLLDPGRELMALGDLAGAADLVVIDAPCSGTGTWRRNPEARWRITPDRLARLTALQARLIDIGARLVRPGGRIVYIVCSLLPEEGMDQIAAFRVRDAGWAVDLPDLPAGRAAGDGWMLSPTRDSTDGFFFARLSRPC